MDFLIENSENNPAYTFGALSVIAMEKGNNISVMMPYADSLKYIADWYAQLWAESLGKRFDNNNSQVFCGQTPVKALGVTDQHSQIQLYTEGGFDKTVTFIKVEKFKKEVLIPRELVEYNDISYLCGHTLNELISAELFGTEYALTKSGHLSNMFIMPEVNAFTIGQLLYLLEMATAFAGELLNINAFDQPGVEEGKNATYALLNRKGYEEKLKELQSIKPKDEKFIV
jgi:glucose-6-phosphate isomerase